MKTLFIVTLLIAGMLTTYTQACTRVVYLGKNGMVVTGRTMDWKEDLKSNIYVFPRGIERAGADKGNTIHWKSKYGSVITAGYDIGTSDGMNEKGLVANLLYLTESDYYRPNDTRMRARMASVRAFSKGMTSCLYASIRSMRFKRSAIRISLPRRLCAIDRTAPEGRCPCRLRAVPRFHDKLEFNCLC